MRNGANARRSVAYRVSRGRRKTAKIFYDIVRNSKYFTAFIYTKMLKMRVARAQETRTILVHPDMPRVQKLPLRCKKLKRDKNERCLIMHDKTDTSDKYGLLVTRKARVTEKLSMDAIYISSRPRIYFSCGPYIYQVDTIY